ncbi:MAG: 6-phosphofructokinase, partial [Thermoleophilaceae bacterium]|nr:6-phosphofructokinase [Thermoleophilaceae bacterium]
AADQRRWGTMSALKGTRIELVPLREAVTELRTVPPDDFAVGEIFFG